ncbi:hypothetical protein [Pelosinus sp. IPA-1]|uniref:hypothetical protein n=1 Tax=Pelosinus sp. IPA-1 TaxID=3029569 RepID=UPI0024361FD5|nr:hypothetical protein [Pelosinus sp. IPA-1]GMB00506.1 hypothetical protein PIPA1_33050 [Pelosinus sp. IPA-1]
MLRNQKGWILVDSLIGMIFLGVALISILGAFTQFVSTTSTTRNNNNAVRIAQQISEELKVNDGSKSAPFDLTKSPTYQNSPTINGIKYKVEIVTSGFVDTNTRLQPVKITVSGGSSSVSLVRYYYSNSN